MIGNCQERFFELKKAQIWQNSDAIMLKQWFLTF